LILICFIVLAQAYIFKWLIPVYHMVDTKAIALPADPSSGYVYLLILAGVLIALAMVIVIMCKKTMVKSNLSVSE
jgi:lactate permease